MIRIFKMVENAECAGFEIIITTCKIKAISYLAPLAFLNSHMPE